MITFLRFILFFLLAPVFAIVAQAAGAVQDDFRIVDAGFQAESVALDSVDGGICNYDSSGALSQQRRSLDGKVADEDGLSGSRELEASVAARHLFSFLAEFVAARTGLFSKTGGEAMDAATRLRFNQMANRHGVEIIEGADVDRFLTNNGAQAMTFGDDAFMLHSQATRSGAFEDLIHTFQKRSGQFGDTPADAVRMEIDALETLINYRREFVIPNAQTRESIQLLRQYRQQLEGLQ